MANHMQGALANVAMLTLAGSSTPSVTLSLSLTTCPENEESAIAMRLWPIALPLVNGCHVMPPLTMHSTVHAVTRWSSRERWVDSATMSTDKRLHTASILLVVLCRAFHNFNGVAHKLAQTAD